VVSNNSAAPIQHDIDKVQSSNKGNKFTNIGLFNKILNKKDLSTKKLNDKEKVKKNKQVEQEKLNHHYFNSWRDLDFFTTILAMIGLGLAIGNY